jgi:TonB family protein
MASALHFPSWISLWGGPFSMNRNSKLTAWIVAIFLGGTLSAPFMAKAQNVSADSTGRKVRSKVVPAYPDIARSAHITGKVKIEATIAADGHVTSTKVVGGSPVLVNVAVEALDKWRFEASSSDTTEIIEFQFDGDN